MPPPPPPPQPQMPPPQKLTHHQHEHNSLGLVVVRNLFDRVNFKNWILFLFVFVAAPLLVITYVLLVNFPECQYEYEGFALLFYLTTFHFLFCLYDIIYYPFIHYVKFVRDKYNNKRGGSQPPHWTYICYHTALPFTLYFFLLGWLWSRAQTYVSNVFRYCFCALSFVYIVLFGMDCCYGGNKNDMDSLTWFHGPGIILCLFASVVSGTIFPIGGGRDDMFKEYFILTAVFLFSGVLLVKAWRDRSVFTVSQHMVLSAYMLLIYSIACTLAAFRRMESFFVKKCADDDIEISTGELNIAKVAFYREIFREQTVRFLPKGVSSPPKYLNIDVTKALCILLSFALIVANVCLNYNFFSFMQLFASLKHAYDYVTSGGKGVGGGGGGGSDGFGKACIALTFVFYLVNVGCLISFQHPPLRLPAYMQTNPIAYGLAVGLMSFICAFVFIYSLLYFSQTGTIAGAGNNFIYNLHHMKSIDWTETMKSVVNVAFIVVTTKSILDEAKKVLSGMSMSMNSNRHITSNSQTVEIFFEIVVFGFSFFLLCQTGFLFLHSPSQHRSAMGDYIPEPISRLNMWLMCNFNLLECIIILTGAAIYDVYLTRRILVNIKSKPNALKEAYDAVIKGETAVNQAGSSRKADVPVAAILPALPFSRLFGYNSSSYPYASQPQSPSPPPPPPPPRKV